MLKIINGKKYNTETAEKVGSYWNGRSASDFDYCEESLYKKRTGEFFLYGEGGARSKYARSAGQNCWSGGEMITPMTYEEAQAWAEEHLTGEEYEEIFGEVSEDGETKGVIYSLPLTAIEKVKRKANERRCSASQIIAELIETL